MKAYPRWGVFCLLTLSLAASAAETIPPRAYALKLFQRLTGTPLQLSDPRLEQMEALVKQRKLADAAKVASDDSGFYRNTVRDWAAVMATREETPLVDFDDFQALLIGITRDGIDAREMLTANYRYEARAGLVNQPVGPLNNAHYLDFDNRRYDPKKDLVKVAPQWAETAGIREAAGLLTTRGWAKAHYVMGTNRRAVEYTFREFLCAPIQQWKDVGTIDSRVRRDVDRRPGGDPTTYQKECRGCHGQMDGMGGAFAPFDFVNELFIHNGSRPAAKMNQNSHVFPMGYSPSDNSWINLATQHQNESFGWRGPLEGVGVNEFGAMIANAKAFPTCMATRVFKKICRRDPTPAEQKEVLLPAAEHFENDGYKLRSLFEEIAIAPACSGFQPG